MPVLITLHVIVCLLIVLVILMQRPRSEGLGAAFGGGMTENLFGAQTTQVLVKATTWLAGTFFVITLLLSILTSKGTVSKTAIQESLLNAPVPQATASPAAPTAVKSPEAPVQPPASPATSPAK